MKYCSLCEREHEKLNFIRHSKSKKHQIKTGTKTECNKCINL